MATYKQLGLTPTSTQLGDFEIYGSSRLGTQSNNDLTLATTPNVNYISDDNRASAIVELKQTTFATGNLVQYKVGGTALNTVQYSWNTGVTIQQNTAQLMQHINDNAQTTGVTASLWWSNNATGTLYMKLAYTQPGNWNNGVLECYVNSVLAGSPGQVPKRAMGYGTPHPGGQARGNDIVGLKRYELSNQLGNVLAVISDRKFSVNDGVYNTTTGVKTSSTPDAIIDYYQPLVLAYTDYDPFGTAQEGRKGGASDYRYGFQGQEMDDEVKGEGNSVNYSFRMHDPRLGRFFAIDPLAPKYAHNSPYAFSENRVIDGVELEGLEWDGVINNALAGFYGTGVQKAAKGVQKSVVKAAKGTYQTAKLVTGNATNKEYKAAATGIIGTVLNVSLVGPAKDIVAHQLSKSPKGSPANDVAKNMAAQKKADQALDKGVKAGDPEVIAEFVTDAIITIGGAAIGGEAAVGEVAEMGTLTPKSVTGLSTDAVIVAEEGGLNLFKWGAEQTGTTTGWKQGDYMLYLPNKGTPKLNWSANSGALRRAMNEGKPIYDSYRNSNGELIPAEGFLNAERSLLKDRGWTYNPSTGAWHPPL